MGRKGGITLIQVLIIVIVLGLLAGIVVYAIGDTRSNALKSAGRTTLKSVELSAEAYHTRNDAYPAAGDDADLAEPGVFLRSAVFSRSRGDTATLLP